MFEKITQPKLIDFREATWKHQAATLDGNKLVGSIDRPASGFATFYLMAGDEVGKLSTQIHIEETKM